MTTPDPLVYLFPQLGELDFHSLSVKLVIIGWSFFMTFVVFFLSYLLSFNFTTFKSYLRTKEKVFWCLAFVRGVFGFVAAFFGFWYLAVDDTLHGDVVSANSAMSFMAVYICVGFFLFECIALFTSNYIFRTFDKLLATHHSLSLIGDCVVTYYGKAHFFAVVGLLLEMTTPFTCLCWMLIKAKMTKYRVWKLNQLVLVHLFHCRTMIEGYFYLKSYSHWENIATNMPLTMICLLYTQLSIQFFYLTPYWTYKKMMQLFNPIDWNHPELQSERAQAIAGMNGHTDGNIPIENVPNGHNKRD